LGLLEVVVGVVNLISDGIRAGRPCGNRGIAVEEDADLVEVARAQVPRDVVSAHGPGDRAVDRVPGPRITAHDVTVVSATNRAPRLGQVESVAGTTKMA